MNRRNFLTQVFQISAMVALTGLNTPQVASGYAVPHSERVALINEWSAKYEQVAKSAIEITKVLNQARQGLIDEAHHKHFFELTDDFHGLLDDVSHDMEMVQFEELFKAVCGKDSFHCAIEGEIAEASPEDLTRLENDIPVYTGNPETQAHFYALIEARRQGGAS